ncbi:unnamed protein product [Chrysoparadoxa australica]
MRERFAGLLAVVGVLLAPTQGFVHPSLPLGAASSRRANGARCRQRRLVAAQPQLGVEEHGSPAAIMADAAGDAEEVEQPRFWNAVPGLSNSTELGRLDDHLGSTSLLDMVSVAPPGHRCVGQGDKVKAGFVEMFRGSAPYMKMHSGSTMVIHIPGELVDGPLFQDILDDVALLNLLRVRVVLVQGCRPQINSRLKEHNSQLFSDGHRVTDLEALRAVKEAAGYVRFEVEAGLTHGSRGPNRVLVAGGNFYSAQPVGVKHGVDFKYTGFVRKVEVEKIERRLAEEDVVLLTCIGFSTSGEVFNVNTESLAAVVAVKLKAAKVVYITQGEALVSKSTGQSIQCLRLQEVRKLVGEMKVAAGKSNGSDLRMVGETPAEVMGEGEGGGGGPTEYSVRLFERLRQCIYALGKGVSRAHLVSPANGALLQELFTRDGSGLLLSRDIYDGIRGAQIEDLPGILQIIQPLQMQGILVERSPEQIEQDILNFFIFTRDGATIACAMLKRYSSDIAEIGCFAVHPKYRAQGKGEAMLGYLDRVALASGIKTLFVLSTRTMQWFLERGFEEVSVEVLPESRRKLYNWERRSKVYAKHLSSTRDLDAEELFWSL